jgi:hypothetical protein
MIGLPTEKEEDLEGIISLINRILEIKRNMRLNVTISPFVPKPHTPFQWERQCGIDEIREKEEYLSSRLSDRRLNLQLRNPEVSVLEGILARGGTELWPVLLEAVRRGAKFEGWTEHFNFSTWEKALAEFGIDPGDLISGRDPARELPWSRFNTLVSGRFLLKEREKAYQGELTPDCREGVCSGCGVCGCLDEKAVSSSDSGAGEEGEKESAGDGRPDQDSGKDQSQPVYFRYRCTFSKTGKIRFIAHGDLVDVLRRAIKRTGLPVCYSGGFHPQSRISLSPPLAVGMEGEKEFFDMKLCRKSDISPGIFEQLLPEGITVTECAGPFSRSKGKLPENSIFHYYLDFNLIRHIIESGDDYAGKAPAMDKYSLLGQALGLDKSAGEPAGLVEPASLLRDELDALFGKGGSITDRKGRERSTKECRTGELRGDILELFLAVDKGVGVTPADLLALFLPGELVPLVRIRRKSIYYRRGGEYLDPVELVS